MKSMNTQKMPTTYPLEARLIKTIKLKVNVKILQYFPPGRCKKNKTRTKFCSNNLFEKKYKLFPFLNTSQFHITKMNRGLGM